MTAAAAVPEAGGVDAALLELARDLDAGSAAQVGGDFTSIPAADALIKSSPEAFLFGVLFAQGVPAERAWAGPYLLAERLGHLDLARLASEREAVDAAVCAPPALHRFKHTMAGWISDAAQRLLDCHEGDARRIWSDRASVTQVSDRLSTFPGIGRKKAAMAVEILRRHFGVPLTGLDEGTVAYDVHVRRVFLRAGLAEADTPEQIASAARAVAPAAPGSLDLAAWLVGREWCRPRDPHCEACALGPACPRRTWLQIEGVGVRRPRVGARR